MKKSENLGKNLSKQEQKKVLGGNQMTTGDLECQLTSTGAFNFVANYGDQAGCVSTGIPEHCDPEDPSPEYYACRCDTWGPRTCFYS